MLFFKNQAGLKKAALFALITATLIIGTVTVFRAAIFEKSRTDLTVYLRAAEAVVHHENIYTVENIRHWHYVYLPLLAILLTPFVSLPLGLIAALWYLLSAGALIGVFRGLQSLFPKHPNSFWIILCVLILSLPPTLNTLVRGQLGAISLYLTLLVFLLDYRGKKFSAGFILGFAIVLKMSPLLILPFYFLINRNWRALLGCGLSGLFFAVIFPSLVLSPELNLKYLLTYFRTLSEASGNSDWKSYLWGELFTPFAEDNQSFYAIATRLFWGNETAYIGHSNSLIRTLNLGLLASLTGLVAWIMIRGKNFATFQFSAFKGKAWTHVSKFTEYSLLSMVMLFTSPVSQPHHYTPLMLLGTAAFLNIETNPSFKKILLGSMAVCFVFFALGMLFDPLAVLGLPFLGSLLLWMTVFTARLKTA